MSCYYDVVSIHSRFFMISRVLFHNLSVANLNGIVTSTFKVGAGGRFSSPSLLDHIFGVFPSIFVSYANDLPSEILS